MSEVNDCKRPSIRSRTSMSNVRSVPRMIAFSGMMLFLVPAVI